jgi:two-component system cell cycle response regulator DivK
MKLQGLSKAGERIVPKRVLYIEDDPNHQRLLRKVLVKQGHEVIIAGDGTAGIKLAESQSPDLILVDIQMRGLDGLETVRCLRQIDTCRETPIVALTAYVEKYEHQSYIDAGFTDYQQKQAGIDPLLDLVRRYLK